MRRAQQVVAIEQQRHLHQLLLRQPQMHLQKPRALVVANQQPHALL